MKFWKVEISNGYCGFDDEFLVESEQEPEPMELFEQYVYCDGGGGLDPWNDEDGDFESYDDYVEQVLENIFCEEITEEEARAFEEDGWEYR